MGNVRKILSYSFPETVSKFDEAPLVGVLLRHWPLLYFSGLLLVSFSVPPHFFFGLITALISVIAVFSYLLSRLTARITSYARTELRLDPRNSTRVSGFSLTSIDHDRPLRIGDEMICSAGATVPADGVILKGMSLVDESAITGESAPVIRESGTDRDFLYEGSRILSNEVVIKITSAPKSGVTSKIKDLLSLSTTPAASPASSRKIPRAEILLIAAFFVASLAAVFLLKAMGPEARKITFSWCVFGGVLLSPLWIFGELQTRLGIAFADLAVHRNLLPVSIGTIDRAGEIDTIFVSELPHPPGERLQIVKELLPAPDVTLEHLARAAQLACLYDETGPRRAVVTFVKTHFGFLAQSLTNKHIKFINDPADPQRISGIQIFSDEGEDGMRSILLGTPDDIRRHVEGLGGYIPSALQANYDLIRAAGETALMICEGKMALGLIHFYESQTSAISSLFASLERLGFEILPIETKSVSKDRVDSDDAQKKLIRVRLLQNDGRRVAYIGQCASDCPALAQADLKLVAARANESMMLYSDATNVRGDHLQFKHLFRLGRELKNRRGDLRVLCFFSTLATIVTIAPGVYFKFASLPPLSVLAPTLAPDSILDGAMISATTVACATGLLLMTAVVGLHNRRGKLNSMADMIFSTPWLGFLLILASWSGTAIFIAGAWFFSSK